MIKAVVFDMDGVLFDSEQLCKECFCQVAKQDHMPDMDKLFGRFIGLNVTDTRAVFEEYYSGQYDFDEFLEKATRLFRKKVEEEGIPVKYGVKQFLDFLKTQPLRIGLASSTRKERVLEMLKIAGLSEYFEVVIGGDMVTHSKPDPEIYRIACEALEVEPENAYAIEDSYNGIRSAKAAGMKPIMVPDLLPPNDEMKKLSFCICDDLLKVLEEKSLWQV